MNFQQSSAIFGLGLNPLWKYLLAPSPPNMLEFIFISVNIFLMEIRTYLKGKELTDIFIMDLSKGQKWQKHNENTFLRYYGLFNEILSTSMSNVNLRFYFPPKKFPPFLNAKKFLKHQKKIPRTYWKNLKNCMLPILS